MLIALSKLLLPVILAAGIGASVATVMAHEQPSVAPAANTALSTNFTYQGRLTAASANASGPFDFQLALFDQASGGAQVGATITANDLTVTNGIFSIALDFGASAFTGSERYLDVKVRAGASVGPYDPLSRQRLTATPYAIYATTAGVANSAPWAGLTGVPAGFADGIDADTLAALGSCQVGQVVKWNGTAWACAADEIGAAGTGDITAVIAGTGLTGGATAGDATLNVAFAGDGTANTAARSDHNHLGESWTGSANTGLHLTDTAPGGTGIMVGTTTTDSTAIWATNSGNCGVAPQVCYGVYANATASPGGNGFGGVGVRGDGNNAGVIGTGSQYGVYGSSDGTGVEGVSDAGVAVAGKTTDGVGVSAVATGGQGSKAIEATSTGQGGAIYALSSGLGPANAAVYGSNQNPDRCNERNGGYGGFCMGLAGEARGIGAVGVYAQVFAPLDGNGGRGFAAVFAIANNSDWAGYFLGDVNISNALVADDVIPPDDNFGAGHYLGDTVHRWTAVYSANGAIQTSDARLKTDVTGIDYGLDQVLALRPVSFLWKDGSDDKTHLGLLAQDVEQVVPEVVDHPADDAAPLGIAYDGLIPVLIKAIQQQQDEITVLQGKGGEPAGDSTPAALAAPASATSRGVPVALMAALVALTGLVTLGATVAGTRVSRRTRR